MLTEPIDGRAVGASNGRDPGGALPERRRGLRAPRREAGDALRLRQPGRAAELPPGHQASPLIPPRRRAGRPASAAEPRKPSPPPCRRLDGRPLAERAVVDLLLPFEGFLAAGERLEIATTV